MKLLLVVFAAIPLIWSSHREYRGQPFRQICDAISCLVEVTVLVDVLLKPEDSDTN